MCGIHLKNFSLTPDTLFFDLEGLFFRVENSKKKIVKQKYKIILKTFYI